MALYSRLAIPVALAAILGGLSATQSAEPPQGPAPRWRALIETLVNVNSGSNHLEGLERMRTLIRPEFERLGFVTTIKDLENGRKLLSFEMPGAKPELLLVGHIDTIFEKDHPYQKFSESPGKLHGPGVIDMKGGIVLMLNVLEELKDPAILSRVRIVINDDEELESPNSKGAIRALAAGIRYALVFEPGIPGGDVVSSESGIRWLKLTVKGKAAHAGMEHDLGVNACVELGDKISRISRLTDYSKRLTINAGVIEGGIKPNVVCEQASAKLDIRYVQQADLRRTESAIAAIAAKASVYNPKLKLSPTATTEELMLMPSFPPESSEKIMIALREAAIATGQKVQGQHVGYGSDGNFLAAAGLQVLAGVGPYGAGMHTPGEFMDLESYGRRLALNLALIRNVVAMAAREGAPGESTVLLRGGTVYDGTGAKGRRLDVRVRGDQILEMGRSLKARSGEKIIDAKGMAVAPGFIDSHSHADSGILQDLEAETQIRQGITTAIGGQDGSSMRPLREFYAKLERTPPAINLASFVGHGTVRREVMGEDFKREARPEEIARMQALIEDDMKSGALGLSSGLEYDPGFYATTAELIAGAKSASAHGGIYISHVRDEGDKIFDSIDEIIRIAREARIPAQISHIKLGTAAVWNRASQATHRIEAARKSGLDITADVYPYLYWQSTITALVVSRDFKNPEIWKKGLADVGGPGNVRLATYTPDPTWADKTIAEIAALSGKTPVAVVQEIVERTAGKGALGAQERVIVTAMAERDLEVFFRTPWISFSTDGQLKGTHPRGAGSYPRVLGRYVRERRLMTLAEAIRKATALPAKRFGLKDRGTLAPGMKADIVVFDPASVIDRATPQDPRAEPVGIHHVMVNGQLVLESGQPTGARPGRGLSPHRHPH